MPKPRIPREKARITGVDRHHPSRFARRSAPHSMPLGSPWDWMEDSQRAAWELSRREVPWLMESDRVLVEIAACIRARVMAGEEVGVGVLNQLRMCMAQMRATPADRSKLAMPDEPDGDPADAYFQ